VRFGLGSSVRLPPPARERLRFRKPAGSRNRLYTGSSEKAYAPAPPGALFYRKPTSLSEALMSGPSPPSVFRYLRRLADDPAAQGVTDADLLRRFVGGRDEAAFELLLWRHAGMVLRVCRGVLGDAHDAEDAFQATFLVLARKAGSVGRGEA